MKDFDVENMVGHIESLDSYAAIRFEPGIYIGERYPRFIPAIKRANQCSQDTARMINSTSWGRFQLMGFVIYGMEPGIKIAEFLADHELQRSCFFEHLKMRKIDYSMPELLASKAARTQFAKVYNGDGIEYRKRMETYMTNQGFKYAD